MKKTILRIVTFILVFVIATVVINKIMNKDYDNLTVEMSEASLPVVTMLQAGEAYNTLYGHVSPLKVAFMRDSITPMGETRELQFSVDLKDRSVEQVDYEIRNKSGERLIENGQVTELDVMRGILNAKITLKDLYEREEEYILVLKLQLGNNRTASYYTRIVWSTELHLWEKLEFIKDFHERLYNKEAAKELTKYLEPNSSLADNASFHKVNIHSSFKQVTWGDLKVEEISNPSLTIKEISNQTMGAILDYRVKHVDSEGEEAIYLVQEYFRVRYTPDRMYLLDYERTTDQLPNVEEMYGNDKILFGIGSDQVDMKESTDGNTVVFQNCNRLFSYNTVTNKLVVLFSFYQDGKFDERTLLRNHGIKILGVDEAGNVDYVVYGYMNRGIHEGQTGIWVRRYESSTNTTKECLFVPSEMPYEVLKVDAEKLLYLNKEGKFYFLMADQVWCADLDALTLECKEEIRLEDSLLVSRDQNILVWKLEETEKCHNLLIENLGESGSSTIGVGTEEILCPLGFIGEDIIYGLAKKEDMVREITGKLFMPMYKLVITDYRGKVKKEYENENVFVTDCTVESNQITLKRVKKKSNGDYESILDDHITNNEKKQDGKNKVSVPAIDLYGRYVQLQVKSVIDKKSLQILNPKDIVFEGGRELTTTEPIDLKESFYVFGPYGTELVTTKPEKAVIEGYRVAGTVVSDSGNTIWKRIIRNPRNQIMAIKEPEKTSKEESLAVCLSAILQFEGIQRDTQSLLARGKTLEDILQEGLENYQVLSLQGCNLDSVLYYVNNETPVLAIVGDEAVLITGFNEFNTVIYQPSTGQLYKKGMNDSAAWFEKYGNQFFTYSK